MKRILALILSAVLMLSISVPAYATGDENIDGGGGTWAAEHLQAIGIPAWMASVYP